MPFAPSPLLLGMSGRRLPKPRNKYRCRWSSLKERSAASKANSASFTVSLASATSFVSRPAFSNIVAMAFLMRSRNMQHSITCCLLISCTSGVEARIKSDKMDSPRGSACGRGRRPKMSPMWTVAKATLASSSLVSVGNMLDVVAIMPPRGSFRPTAPYNNLFKVLKCSRGFCGKKSLSTALTADNLKVGLGLLSRREARDSMTRVSATNMQVWSWKASSWNSPSRPRYNTSAPAAKFRVGSDEATPCSPPSAQVGAGPGVLDLCVFPANSICSQASGLL
mmetsp:Transcript_81844/g.265099  ORF Transcript_81844/g.265099 Transcript_81844/m.265099 type:complete len:280 (-) Transcript_81844:3300-4139(-)